MASKNSKIERATSEFGNFLDYYSHEFYEAQKNIKSGQGWAVNDTDIYNIIFSLYSNLYDELYPKLSENNPATDEEITDLFRILNNYVKERVKQFEQIAKSSKKNELTLAETIVYDLVKKTEYKLREVLNLINQDLDSRSKPSKIEENNIVAFVTATITEQNEVLSLLEQPKIAKQNKLDSNIYYEGIYKKDDFQIKVVVTKTHHQGLAASATTTTKLLQKYKPKLIFMVGHQAGNKNKKRKLKLGHILIGEESVDYQQNEVIQKNESIRYKDRKRSITINSNLKSHLEAFIQSKNIFGNIQDRYPYKDKIEFNLDAHIGKIVSGSALLRASDRFDEIIKQNQGLIGLDMETHAFYYSCQNCYQSKEPLFVSIKSISDFGQEKNDFDDDLKSPLIRQEYASFTSANFAFEFLKYFADEHNGISFES